MAASSLSVVGNANRLRRYHPVPLPATGQDHAEPQVETPRTTASVGEAAEATDPVCGMSVDPATALRRSPGGVPAYFCSAGCADTFDADPGRYPAVTTALTPDLGARLTTPAPELLNHDGGCG